VQPQTNRALLTKARSSGLTPADVTALQLRYITAQQCPKQLPAQAAGIVIPYFDIAGKRTAYYRYRYMEPTNTGLHSGERALRYAQPKGSAPQVYLPPLRGVNWEAIAADATTPVIITEGEFKAACATKHGLPTIGLGGVWSFKQGTCPWLPTLGLINWAARTVYIVYDSDAATNPDVLRAELALARTLVDNGSVPHIVRLPPSGSGKVGLDDYITANGVAAVTALIHDSEPYAAAAELHRLNTEVIYVADPGFVVRRDNMQKLSARAFVEHAYSDRTYLDARETKNGTSYTKRIAPREWLAWPRRAVTGRLTYAPGGPALTPQALNTWTGWGCAPVKGDIDPWQRLMDAIFKGADAERQHFMRWLAYPLQHPGAKLATSCVIWGRLRGTGKSFIGWTMREIYGTNFVKIDNRALTDARNEWAQNKQFVMGEEITGGDKRGVAEHLRDLITQETIRIDPKYIPSFDLPDCINYYFTSNNPDSFFIDDVERRYFIHEVTGKTLPVEYFTNVYDPWRRTSGPSALFYHLLHSVDTSDFLPHAAAPRTTAMQDMMRLGRSDLACWVASLLEDPDTALRVGDAIVPYSLYSSADLLAIYQGCGDQRVTANGLSRELRRAGLHQLCDGVGCRTNSGQLRLWAIRNPEHYTVESPAMLGTMYDDERNTTSRSAKF